MAKLIKTYKTSGGKTVREYDDGTKKYLGYAKKNNAGKPTDRKITVIKKPGQPDTSEHTAKTEENEKRRSEGRKQIPKGSPGKGQQVAHKSGSKRSDTATAKTEVQSARKNIGDGNRRRK